MTITAGQEQDHSIYIASLKPEEVLQALFLNVYKNSSSSAPAPTLEEFQSLLKRNNGFINRIRQLSFGINFYSEKIDTSHYDNAHKTSDDGVVKSARFCIVELINVTMKKKEDQERVQLIELMQIFTGNKDIYAKPLFAVVSHFHNRILMGPSISFTSYPHLKPFELNNYANKLRGIGFIVKMIAPEFGMGISPPMLVIDAPAEKVIEVLSRQVGSTLKHNPHTGIDYRT